jgi:hypothetical protein
MKAISVRSIIVIFLNQVLADDEAAASAPHDGRAAPLTSAAATEDNLYGEIHADLTVVLVQHLDTPEIMALTRHTLTHDTTFPQRTH